MFDIQLFGVVMTLIASIYLRNQFAPIKKAGVRPKHSGAANIPAAHPPIALKYALQGNTVVPVIMQSHRAA
jgi:hypothetical protein